MAAPKEDEYVVICMPVDGTTPIPGSVRTVCADCGYAVWVSEQMKANVLDAHAPNSFARCITCARKWALKQDDDEIKLAPIPEWQRAEVPHLDLDQLSVVATQWLNGK